MIKLSRFNGTEIYLNPELVLSMEATPDTVITMTNGEKYIVAQRPDEVVLLFEAYQRRSHPLQVQA